MRHLKTYRIFESYQNSLQDLLDTLQSEIFDEYDIVHKSSSEFQNDFYSVEDGRKRIPPYWSYSSDDLGDRIFIFGLNKKIFEKIDDDLGGELKTIIKDRTGLEYLIQSFRAKKYNIIIEVVQPTTSS